MISLDYESRQALKQAVSDERKRRAIRMSHLGPRLPGSIPASEKHKRQQLKKWAEEGLVPYGSLRLRCEACGKESTRYGGRSVRHHTFCAHFKPR